MIGGWVVEAAIRFTSNGVQTMERISASTNAAEIQQKRLRGEITAQEAAWLRLQGRFDGINARSALMYSNISKGIALVGAAMIGDSLVQASQLQRTLIAIKNETGAGADQMERFYQTIFKIGNIMGVSPGSAGAVMLNISRMTAGTLTTRQMQQIAPSIAGFASTLNFNRPNVSVDDATMYGLQIAHMFRAYKPSALNPLLDEGYRLSGLMGEQPQQAVRQMSYYAPMFKGLGIDNQATFAMMALLDRAGFRNKVGTNVRAMVLQELGPLQLTKHYQEGQGRILEQMGIFRHGRFAWNTASGGVDFLGELNAIAQWSSRLERAGVPKSTIFRDIYGALGKQGGTIGSLMSDPQVVGILAGIERYLRDQHVSLAVGEQNRQGSVSFQAGRAWGNFQADLTELGYRATWVTKDISNLADSFHNFQAWLHAHRTAEDWIGGLGVGVTALAGLGASAKLMGGALNLLNGGFKTMPAMFGKIATEGGAATRVLGPFAALLASIAGLEGLDWLRKLAIDRGQGSGFTDKYEAYLRGLHGPYAGSAPMWPNMVPAGGGMTPNQFKGHLLLQEHHITPSGNHGGGGFGVPYKGHSTVHVSTIEMHFPNVRDAKGVGEAVADAVNQPMSLIRRAGGLRTSANIPRIFTVGVS